MSAVAVRRRPTSPAGPRLAPAHVDGRRRGRIAGWLFGLVDADSVRYEQAVARATPLVFRDLGKAMRRPTSVTAPPARGSAP